MKLLINNGRVFQVNNSGVFCSLSITLPIPEDLEGESMTFFTEESEEESMGRVAFLKREEYGRDSKQTCFYSPVFEH